MSVAAVNACAPNPSAASAAGEAARATRAAQEFEALLIGNMLRSLQKSFSSLPGEEQKPAGFDDYHYMATQAIASALSAAGGLGLSRVILKQLVHPPATPPQPEHSDGKSYSPSMPAAECRRQP